MRPRKRVRRWAVQPIAPQRDAGPAPAAPARRQSARRSTFSRVQSLSFTTSLTPRPSRPSLLVLCFGYRRREWHGLASLSASFDDRAFSLVCCAPHTISRPVGFSFLRRGGFDFFSVSCIVTKSFLDFGCACLRRDVRSDEPRSTTQATLAHSPNPFANSGRSWRPIQPLQPSLAREPGAASSARSRHHVGPSAW